MLDVLLCLVLIKKILSSLAFFWFRFAEPSSGSGDDSVESDADVYEGEDKEAVGHDSSSRHYTSGNILI